MTPALEQLTLDALVEWVKQDPGKVERIILAEKVAGDYGTVLITYHQKQVVSIVASCTRKC